jgi:glycosyltransferase involved in cell wall biosynthesis
MTPSLTIAVPSIGRHTLTDTLASIASQALEPHDQVLVVFDSHDAEPSHQRATQALVERYGFTFVAHDGGYHFFGNPQLNRAMELATGDYFCALGDDDIYVAGAIARLRSKLTSQRAVLFQFYAPPDMVANRPGLRLRLWSQRRLRVANISGCCIAAPRSALVPVKSDRRIEVDYEWIVEMVAKTGQRPIWMRDCLVIARPERRNGLVLDAGVVDCLGCGATNFREHFDADGVCAVCAPTVVRAFLGAA